MIATWAATTTTAARSVNSRRSIRWAKSHPLCALQECTILHEHALGLFRISHVGLSLIGLGKTAFAAARSACSCAKRVAHDLSSESCCENVREPHGRGAPSRTFSAI